MMEKQYPTRAALEMKDPSVYTGAAGVAYMYWRLATTSSPFVSQKQEYLDKSEAYISAALRMVKPSGKSLRTSTFLTGIAGVYAVAAAIAFTKRESARAVRLTKEVLDLAPTCVTEGVPNEMLYGRCGYLSCLLFLSAHADLDLKDCGEIITTTIQMILNDGVKLADERFPLMWEWHEKKYFGAAHGVCGILTILLYFRKIVDGFGCEQRLKGSIDAMIASQFESGNLPSSMGNAQDKLVQWCHGAPGLLPLLVQAHKEFGEPHYEMAAKNAERIICDRGLLKKVILGEAETFREK